MRDIKIRSSEPAPAPAGHQRRWALLVGVNHYVDAGFRGLRYCVNDVLGLAGVLRRNGYALRVLHDDAGPDALPTLANVRRDLSQVCQHAAPGDLLFVYFACHGELVEACGRHVLVVRDSIYNDLADTSLPVHEVEVLMRARSARKLVLVLDACHSGANARAGRSQRFDLTGHLAEGFVVIASCSERQGAIEREDVRHGALTYSLIQGLGGGARRAGGVVTTSALCDYINDEFAVLRQRAKLHQQPTFKSAEVRGNIVLADCFPRRWPRPVAATIAVLAMGLVALAHESPPPQAGPVTADATDGAAHDLGNAVDLAPADAATALESAPSPVPPGPEKPVKHHRVERTEPAPPRDQRPPDLGSVAGPSRPPPAQIPLKDLEPTNGLYDRNPERVVEF